jgi:ABC-type polysaccharide/polyol phosphate export permease
MVLVTLGTNRDDFEPIGSVITKMMMIFSGVSYVRN